MTGSGHWLSYSITGDWQRAPGDTVDLHAYFAGEEVNRIQWTISTTVLLGSFGVDTYYDVISLQSLVVPGSYMEYSGGLTDSVVFSLYSRGYHSQEI